MSADNHVSRCFALATKMIKEKCENLTQEESLSMLTDSHNCVNWTLGHVLATRNHILKTLDIHDFDWSEQDDKAYNPRFATCQEATQSAAQNGRTIESLLVALDASQALLKQALQQKELSAYTEMKPFMHGETSVERIVHFLLWHDATHAGEIDALGPAVQK